MRRAWRCSLAEFDDVMKVSVSPDKARQSVISSSLNTAINGASDKDNLVNALLANVGSQINAEGAGLIGDNGEILGVPGKTVSHAVLAGISAEIGGGNGKGAAAGVLAAELAGVILGDNTIKPEEWQRKSEQQAQMAKVLGATAGAVFTGRSDGVYSGANAGETTFSYNYLSHKQQALMDKDLAAAKTPLEKAFVLARWGVTSGKQDGAYVAGLEFGKLMTDAAGTLLGVTTVAKSGVKLATNAVKALEKATVKAGSKGALTYVDEPFFNPYGTLSAGQAWTTKSRLKYVQLPNEGKIMFVPPADYSPSNALRRGPGNGYIDKFGNEWVKGPS